ncbi:MAG: LemA family protein [Deltaproteobacteria bacterium]|nr:LemA family protein [Deltaproteobacteria bacterium]
MAARTRLALSIAATTILGLLAPGCGYNRIQGADEQVKAAWAEVGNQYQRRADLVQNLVNTVKGSADFERGTLEAVVNARAKATSIQATPELVNDPAAFQRFEAAQGELSSALSRLLVTVERYPDLKASASFRDLQAQLEGTENRIAVARNRYIEAVAEYNKLVRFFPTNLTARFLLGAEVRPSFEARPGAETPPEVKF